MEANLTAVVVGGVIALFSVGLGEVARWWQGRTRRDHELVMEQLSTLRATCSQFAVAMGAARAAELSHQREYGQYATQEMHGPDGVQTRRREPEAERVLVELRLLTEGPLLDAARAWLQEHYREHWDLAPGPGEPEVDLPGAEARFFEEAQRALKVR